MPVGYILLVLIGYNVQLMASITAVPKKAIASRLSTVGYARLLICVLLTCAPFLMRTALGAGLVDDTFIFLRYARNFADGAGLVFNVGDRVEGYTSLLWVLILGLCAKLQVDLLFAALAIGSLLGLATVVLLLFSARSWVPTSRWYLACVPALFLVVSPVFEYWAWSGLDVPLFSFLFLATFLTFLNNIHDSRGLLAAGVLFTLATTTRLEMLVLLPVYIAFIFYFNRRNKELLLSRYASFLAPLVLLAVEFLWRYFYYGSWLPNTFYAKVAVPLSALLSRGVAYTSEFALTCTPYLAIILLGLILVRRQGALPDKWKLAFAVVLTWAAYVTWVGGDHFAMYRFYVPVLPVLGLLFASCFSYVIDVLPWSSRKRSATAVLLTIVCVYLLSYAVYQDFGGDRARAEVQIANSWTEVGIWFKQNMPAHSTLAAMSVGAIPYYSGFTCYDMLGLTDKTVARDGKVYPEGAIGHQKYDSDYILNRRPRYIIYPWSGLYTQPVDPSTQEMPQYYYYSVYDLVKDPRTSQLYQFKAVRMQDGRYIDYLQLKEP